MWKSMGIPNLAAAILANAGPNPVRKLGKMHEREDVAK